MKFVIFLFAAMLLFSCQKEEQIYVPKPHQYPRIEFPAKEYKSLSLEDCPFEMEIPAYSSAKKKEVTSPQDQQPETCWFDVQINQLNATIHWSYYDLDEEEKFEKLVNDAFTLASKHNSKASFREEFVLKNKYGSGGLIFKINGPVATPYQFFVTDSTNHFLRGALYFDEKVDYDSVAPVVQFIEEDIDKMLYTLQWN